MTMHLATIWLAACGWALAGEAAFEPVRIPDWVHGVTRMVFLTPGEIEMAEKVRAQVVHTNVVWPYYPLRRDGGGLSAEDAKRLRAFVEECHRRGMKVVLGLPPFMPVNLAAAHPEWRVHPDDSGAVLRVKPLENDLGTRSGCNVGPWGDYLIDVLAELLADYRLDGYSFDGNYHPPICFCPACKAAYRNDCGLDLPKKADLDDLAYRSYLVWRGERLEEHYRRMQKRLKGIDPNAVLMSWTVNAGRYGHLLTSPRAMPTRLNLLFDLPMQEWWLDETNLGASVAPAFGLAYLHGIVGGRPAASEPYLMSRGNPYSSDSFPRHERIARGLMALTYGNLRRRRSGSQTGASRWRRSSTRSTGGPPGWPRPADSLGGPLGQRADPAVPRLQGHSRAVLAARFRRLSGGDGRASAAGPGQRLGPERRHAGQVPRARLGQRRGPVRCPGGGRPPVCPRRGRAGGHV